MGGKFNSVFTSLLRLDLDYDEYVETLRSDFLSHADFLDFLNALG